MAKPSRPSRPHRASASQRAAGQARTQRTGNRRAAPQASIEQDSPGAEGGDFILGAVPGTTPGKWMDLWRERMPRVPLVLQPITFATQRAAIARVDVALIRLPIDTTGLHTIPLYDETTVVIFPADSHLAAADELSSNDLRSETVIIPGDDVLGWSDNSIPAAVPRPATTADAIELTAAGVGIVVTPMSLARLHHRKDVDYRPLVAGPISRVALAWEAERSTALVEAFVGIVRGRTPRSSR